ncbi:guanine deaminase [Alteromonas sp. KUL42]|uniref:guanine deaminase n=1 Tax=Alteromonas sp. KUL42 TaxID=2480797 RepID=UPI0007914F6D|nr:guanine deaminase [Alteromonas sp. KUL42]KXJ62098.1 MAG: guanine deaminase [Alteromonas sp. Nap_26]TAP34355.1 guanine deaminase [Alteromonas sp. KUL42]GEA07752.1 guanine deaminase [Alteromonas sp. KUL42]
MQLFRASIAHFSTRTSEYNKDITIYKDGGLVIDGKHIKDIGPYSEIAERYPNAAIKDLTGKWVLPGLIDSHLHFPQTQSIAHYGEQLLSWLENYTFPTEMQFADNQHAEAIAKVFLQQLVKNGTTTGLVFTTVHKESCDALFRAASEIDMAMIAGKVCMDRHCPSELQDTAQSAQLDSAQLIETWHNKGRNRYALTPRFAPTSTDAQLAAMGELAQQYKDVFIQTHLSENLDEIAWVKRLFPNTNSYLDVYDKYNLVRERAVFGHGIYLSPDEWTRLSEANATLAFCPTSNLFLGSGLFDMTSAKANNVHVALATDVGAGTTFNMFNTYADAYKVSQLRNAPICPLEGFYLMTQGAALAHRLDDEIGNLNPGSMADFIVVEPRFDELTSLRIKQDATFDDVFFALSILGDDRAIEQTWISGRCCYTKKSPQ